MIALRTESVGSRNKPYLSKIELKLFSNGKRAWDRSIKVSIENVGSLLTMKDRDRRVQDLNMSKGQSGRWRVSRSSRGQSSGFGL